MYLGGRSRWLPLVIGRTWNDLSQSSPRFAIFFLAQTLVLKRRTQIELTQNRSNCQTTLCVSANLGPSEVHLFLPRMVSDAGQVSSVDAICELRTEELNAVFCNNAKSGIEKHHHSLKCRKLRLLQQGP